MIIVMLLTICFCGVRRGINAITAILTTFFCVAHCDGEEDLEILNNQTCIARITPTAIMYNV